MLLYRLAARLVARPGEVRGTDSPTFHFQAGHTPSWDQARMRAALPSVAGVGHQLLRLLSPLLSGGSGPATSSAMLPVARARRKGMLILGASWMGLGPDVDPGGCDDRGEAVHHNRH